MKEQIDIDIARQTLPVRIVEDREQVTSTRLVRGMRSALLNGVICLFLIIMSIFALFPIYYVIQASFAGGQNLYTTDVHLLPSHPTFDN